MAKKKKKGLIKFKIFLIILLLISIIYMGYFIYNKLMLENITLTKMYLSSSEVMVSLYNEETKEEVLTLPRGLSLNVYDKDYPSEEIVYKKVSYNDIDYLVKIENLVIEEKDIIKETNLFVRTPVTIYVDFKTSKILGYLPKGSELEITGYDRLKEGIVNMYKIKYNDTEGYVYAKYLVTTSELANLNYNENGTYDIHKDRAYYKELYGGKASNLDYYPYEKPSFKDNILLTDAKTLFLNASEKVLNNVDAYIDLAKETNINAFVVDIKDGFLAYPSEVAKTYSETSFNSSSRTVEQYKEVIDKLKNNGFYVIGRIVAFNDPQYAKDNPSEAIAKNGVATEWTSAYSRRAWEYNVELAKEAITLFGFNEIQYDYIRFPEAAYSMSTNKAYDLKNTYNEEKGVAIQNFLFYATDEIHKLNTYISADVFGESANTYVTAYGQYWPAISNIVDVISAMPYPDHFNKYDYGFKVPVWTVPYDLLMKWGAAASERQKEIPTPALARTWIQAYDAIHEPKVTYDTKMVSNQIDALYDSGLKNGYITWNASSDITKYKSLRGAFTKEYR